jgi:hypothetical protein
MGLQGVLIAVLSSIDIVVAGEFQQGRRIFYDGFG